LIDLLEHAPSIRYILYVSYQGGGRVCKKHTRVAPENQIDRQEDHFSLANNTHRQGVRRDACMPNPALRPKTRDYFLLFPADTSASKLRMYARWTIKPLIYLAPKATGACAA
jgi:hypothetical protein